ncbi:hypothetical protein [Planktothrix paucivesiculata]|uniref:Type II secretion system protein GspC N-terminal domain-containing protein n=1 Tax=Planktothrix paucivesiculata PCC 9631 TaxID=671071 RepID=A0A7Z9BL94_9CYAN|nr:hypothetical protein [Planktothrix paucivesiculata]VXD15011.1 conserved hypothetical protein [Planktothrix paucivesiculata PCC 9631]
MAQKTMNKTQLEFSEVPIAKAPISVEAYADELMDDIFSDVDRVIQGQSRLPKEAVKPEFVSLKSIKVPQIILPPMPREEAEDPDKLRDASVKKSAPSLDRILLIAAFSSLFITLLLWLATRGGLGRLFAPEPVAVAPEPVLDAKTKADIQFSNYIQRSLTNIEQRNQQTGLGLPLLPPPVANATLPTLPVPATPTVAPVAPAVDTNNLVAAINRVAGAIQDASNQTASLSQQVMNSLAKGQQTPPPAPVTVPGGRGSGSAPAAAPKATASAPATAPKPATPTQVTPSTPQVRQEVPAATIPLPPPPAVTETPTEQPTAVNPAPVTAHTLVGILELGDRSAALFEINGVARRIYVGETIGASGWSLVEVVNQEAVIRRNGEVKTIFVGQQF